MRNPLQSKTHSFSIKKEVKRKKMRNSKEVDEKEKKEFKKVGKKELKTKN